MNEKIMQEYNRWLEKATEDQALVKELNAMKDNYNLIEDSFYQNLSFGTGGIRGVIGAGTAKLNIYTVRKASQGLANYILNNFPAEQRTISIAYDSRINSDVFARAAAGVFAGNGIKTYIYKELMPTPCVSFAIREMKTCAGIMVTASHNPSKYNGYKVYGPDGCQMTTKAADETLAEIEKLDMFDSAKYISFEEGLANGSIEYMPEYVYDNFIANVKAQTLIEGEEVNRDVAIVYSPLNGTGLKPVTRLLKELGFTNVTLVKEQELPDGNFPTCPYPNPEIKEAMALGMEYASKYNADLLMATDPDCDRIGIAVKNKEGTYTLMTGNEVGVLLLDFICSMKLKQNKMPSEPMTVKTIVTTDMIKAVAQTYGVRVKEVLTGFKYIGEQIGLLEKENKQENYLLGFEESYGYLSGTYVRDKDAVNGALVIVEMFAYYKTRGISLLDKLSELQAKYGFYHNVSKSYEFAGAAGFSKMQDIMSLIRGGFARVSDYKVTKFTDYKNGFEDLPPADVLKFELEDGSTVIVRPSGTEPKIKVYTSTISKNLEEALSKESGLFTFFENVFYKE